MSDWIYPAFAAFLLLAVLVVFLALKKSQGRKNRSKLFFVVFWSFVALIALAPLMILIDKYPSLIYAYFALLAAWYFVVGIFFIRACTQRLHDLDQPAWWLLLLLVPYVNIAFVLALLLIPGNPRPNKYGAPNDG